MKVKTKACHQKGLDLWTKPYFSKTEDNEIRRILVIEYKPPCELDLKTLGAGLEDLKRNDLVHCARTPRDQAAKQEKPPKDIIISVIAQVYTYIINSGIQYAYLIVAEAFFFLDLPGGDGQVLYYSLVIPKDASTKVDNDVSCTAIGQVLSFYIPACRGHDSNQDEWYYHRQCAQEWAKNNNKVVANMTPSADRIHTPVPEFKSNRKRDAPAVSGPRSACKLRPSKSYLPLDTKGAQGESGVRYPRFPLLERYPRYIADRLCLFPE